jgi:hypothetical protein
MALLWRLDLAHCRWIRQLGTVALIITLGGCSGESNTAQADVAVAIAAAQSSLLFDLSRAILPPTLTVADSELVKILEARYCAPRMVKADF